MANKPPAEGTAARATRNGPSDENAAPSMPALTHAQTLQRIDELLEVTYRSADLGNHDDPLAEAIYIILSRQTRETVYQATYAEMRERWPTWHDLASAKERDLARTIRAAGFGSSRAKQIKDLLRTVAHDCHKRGLGNAITLDWLAELGDTEAEAYLLGLPGIGPKSARCILHYSLDRAAFAVDTHVRRILDRLALVRDRPGKVVHEHYEKLVPAKMRQRLHINLVHHGRKLCTTRAPRCAKCPLISFCPEGKSRLSHDRRPVAIELFAGAGGLGLGFRESGFHIALAIEQDRNAAQTYRANHPGTIVAEWDVEQVTSSTIRQEAPHLEAITAVIGGPPCQGYSAAGRRDAQDTKNRLFQHQIRLARELQARFIVIENVPGMRSVNGVQFIEDVEAHLREAGFHSRAGIVRASDYGVPQLRRRLIFTGQRLETGDAPAIPIGGYCGSLLADCRCGRPKPPTVLEKLAEIPVLPMGVEAEYRRLPDGSFLLNASTMSHSDRVVTKIARIEPGTGPISYRRLHLDLARTIVAGHRALPVHPIENRTISTREAALLQGFPPSYVFCGSRHTQALQVANAVPPQLGHAIAHSLLATIRDDHHPTLEVDLCGTRQLGIAAARPRAQLRQDTG